ncbi:MAG TPA: UMP kinase [Candidatus Nanoarchaeia archaeon]|nr:UMP kinase [Candidatus Nanoarchaeia archaeon]
METIVISLGGSLIVPESIDYSFLHQFKQTIRKHYKKYKFVLVCGGGSIARRYITSLEKEHKSTLELSLAGIRATRMNALFVTQLFGKEANKSLPKDMHQVTTELQKNKVVICGALRFSPNATSDTTAAKLAHILKAKFINLTNVKGLYSEDPRKNPKAKFIKKTSWKEFEERAHKRKHHPGQHFILDQQAATIIKKEKIPTYILGSSIQNLDRFLSNKKWVGTEIND